MLCLKKIGMNSLVVLSSSVRLSSLLIDIVSFDCISMWLSEWICGMFSRKCCRLVDLFNECCLRIVRCFVVWLLVEVVCRCCFICFVLGLCLFFYYMKLFLSLRMMVMNIVMLNNRKIELNIISFLLMDYLKCCIGLNKEFGKCML